MTCRPSMRSRAVSRGRACLTALAALVLVSACGAGGSDQGGVLSPPPESRTPSPTGTRPGSPSESPQVVETPLSVHGTEVAYHGSRAVHGRSSATIELYDTYYEPTVLIGSPGQKLSLELINQGKSKHSFTLDAQGIDVVLKPGERAKVTVTFPGNKDAQAGFWCRFHLEAGMGGVLVTHEE